MLKLKILFILLITSMLFAQSDDKITLRDKYKDSFYYLKMKTPIFTQSQSWEFANDLIIRMLDLRVLLPHEDGYYYKMTPHYTKYDEELKKYANEVLYELHWGNKLWQEWSNAGETFYSIYDIVTLLANYLFYENSYGFENDLELHHSFLKNINFSLKSFRRLNSSNNKLTEKEYIIPYSLLNIIKAHLYIAYMTIEEDYDKFDRFKEDLTVILNYIENDAIDNKWKFKDAMKEEDEKYGFRMSLYTEMILEMGKLAIQTEANDHNKLAYWIFSDKYTTINDFIEYNNNDHIYDEEEPFLENGTPLFQKYYERFSKAIDYESYFNE